MNQSSENQDVALLDSSDPLSGLLPAKEATRFLLTL
jgi:hypothetical protein